MHWEDGFTNFYLHDLFHGLHVAPRHGKQLVVLFIGWGRGGSLLSVDRLLLYKVSRCEGRSKPWGEPIGDAASFWPSPHLHQFQDARLYEGLFPVSQLSPEMATAIRSACLSEQSANQPNSLYTGSRIDGRSDHP